MDTGRYGHNCMDSMSPIQPKMWTSASRQWKCHRRWRQSKVTVRNQEKLSTQDISVFIYRSLRKTTLRFVEIWVNRLCLYFWLSWTYQKLCVYLLRRLNSKINSDSIWTLWVYSIIVTEDGPFKPNPFKTGTIKAGFIVMKDAIPCRQWLKQCLPSVRCRRWLSTQSTTFNLSSSSTQCPVYTNYTPLSVWLVYTPLCWFICRGGVTLYMHYTNVY